MELNMNTFVKGSKDFIDTSDSTAVIPAEPTTKRRASRKKNNEMVVATDKTAMPIAQTSLSYVQENIPYAQAYTETNRQLDETIAQLNILGAETMSDLQMIRSNKTMRNKYAIANEMTQTTASILSTKLAAIREKNTIINNINKMELDRVKQLKVSASEEDDNTRIANLYNAFINTPVGVGRAPLAPSMQDIITVSPTGSPTPMAPIGSDQQAWEANLSPAENRMVLEAKGSIETVVMYDSTTGNRWFEILDKNTHQPVPNVEKPDSSYIYDLDLNVRGGYAKDSNRNVTYPLITVNNMDSSITEY